MTYLNDQSDSLLFQLQHLGGLPIWEGTAVYGHADAATVRALLEAAACFAEDRLLPLAVTSDRQGCTLAAGAVCLPEGSRAVYSEWVGLGFPGVGLPMDIGGLGLPLAVQCAVQELCDGANLALGMLFINLRCAALALLQSASEEQKVRWLPGLLAGTLASTIVISEPQAGSDVGRIRTLATPSSDGTYLLQGTKIWISYGDHDATADILHLVLARTPGAEAGSRGLSLFAVPKLRDGSGNGTRVARLEHKMGLHASPTCVLEFDEARGELIGSLGKGLQALFVMMNAMRLAVAVQGAAVANAATLQAWRYAAERPQGGPPQQPAVAIVQHADVRRMLLEMTAESELARSLALRIAGLFDQSVLLQGISPAEASLHQQLAEFILPIAKTCNAETAFTVANTGIQVMGGYGYTSDYPMERLARDIRVAAIYEGTSGIQALDLQRRKLVGDGGRCFKELLRRIDATMAVGQTPFVTAWIEIRGLLLQRAELLLSLPKEELSQADGGAYALLQLFGQGLHCWNGHELLLAASTTGQQRRLVAALQLLATFLPSRARLWAVRAAQSITLD